MNEVPPPMNTDNDDLDRLVLFHKIMAGLCLLGSCCGLPHFGIGIAISSGLMPVDPKSPRSAASMETMGPFFALAGLFVILAALSLAVLNFLASKNLAQRKGLNFIYVVSALNLLAQPVGMALGIYTFVVVSRQSIKAQLSR